MPTGEPTVKRNPIPAGDHVLTLVSVEEKEQPAFSNPNVMERRWTWQFKAQGKDPETGEPYEFRAYTGRFYGHPKAGLTLLLDMMLPDWTVEQKSHIDTDTILSRAFRAKIRHERPDKPEDPPRPRLIFIEPFRKRVAGKSEPAPAPEEEVEDLDVPDPFADQ